MTTLQVKCKCGKKLNAKLELAGKRVKCPACGHSLKIPTADGAAPQARTTLSPKPVAKTTGKAAVSQAPNNKAAVPKTDPVADLLDEIGFVAARSRNSCPKCKATLAEEAILCVHCGYHLEKGKALQTKRVGRL